jgi:EamA domain-containing membrane protein RarD
LSTTKLACFILIWVSIAIFCADAIKTYRAARA